MKNRLKLTGSAILIMALVFAFTALSLTGCSNPTGHSGGGGKVTITDVEITGGSSGPEYGLGVYEVEDFDLNSVEVTVYFSDSTSKVFTAADLPQGLTIADDVDKDTAGSYTINISYGGTTVSFPVYVVDSSYETVINIAAIPGVTPPVAGAEPVTTITGTAQYTGTVSWSLTYDPFAPPPVTFDYLEAYTATITLTARKGFTLEGVAKDFFTVAGASPVKNIVNTGVVAAMFPATAGPFSGTGISTDPYLITDAAGLAILSKYVNAGTAPYADSGKYYEITTDLDLSAYGVAAGYNDGKGWIPIGDDYSSNIFNGILDGGGHTITGLSINNSAADYQGLFYHLDELAIVKDLTLKDVNINGKNVVGGMAGANGGTLLNCAVSGMVTGDLDVGGVVGSNAGEMDKCAFTSGTVSSAGNDAGGVAGSNESDGEIKNCWAAGTVIGDNNVGGVVGRMDTGTVENCYSTSTVKGGADGGGIGGVVGYVSDGTVKNCYATGDVEGDYNVGGVVGANEYVNTDSTVQNCYATGAVKGDDSVGGVVGGNYDGKVQNCVALNISVTGNSNFGRVIGQNNDPMSMSSNFAYSGMELGDTVSGAANDKNGLDKSAGEAKTQATYENTSGGLGWGFAGTDASPWKMGTALYTLPVLYWQTAASIPATLPAHLEKEAELTFVTGKGTPDTSWYDVGEPYKISNPDQLAGLAVLINSGTFFAGKTITLTANLDLSAYGVGKSFNSGKGWVHIGYFTLTPSRLFDGIFDGTGKTIIGLSINDSADESALFGYIGDGGVNGGVVKNLILKDVDIRGRVNTGGVVGYNSGGMIQNCGITGTVTGSGNATGGVAGDNTGTIRNCWTAGTVSGGTVSGTSGTGGVAGSNRGQVWNCYSTATVTGYQYAGGVAGYNYSTVGYCYATGAVSGTSGIGGVAGYNGNILRNSAALNSSVNGTGSFTGRVVGYNNGTLNINFAFSGMKVNGSTATGAVNHFNGADKNLAQVKTQTTYTNATPSGLAWAFGGDEDNPWKWGTAPYTLPVLYWQTDATIPEALPTHLK